MYLLACADEVTEQCEVRRSSDKAPHVPAAGASAVSMLSEKLQVAVLLPGARWMFPLLPPVDTREVEEPPGSLGRPPGIQIDERAERKNEVRTDLRSDRRIKLQVHGAGAHPWILERRSGLARGVYNRLVADGRVFGGQILAEVQWRLNALMSGGAYSVYQLIFGSNPVDLWVGRW